MEQLQLQKNPEVSYQNTGKETATPAPLFVGNHDPMLSQQALNDLSNGPQPFYRSQNRKDSGVWSYDRNSETQPPFPKPTMMDFTYGDGGVEDNSAVAQMDGAWYNFPVPNGQSSLELDEDGDESFGV